MDEQAVTLLADGMLGRLAKWLRLLGYDTEYDNEASDLELARRARSEGRILLTRDRELAARRGLRTLLIESQVLVEQVRQVEDELGPPPDPALTRCSVCNVTLTPTDREEVSDKVPPYVLRTQDDFTICASCGRVYWPGSHMDLINQQFEEFESES
jgi:uncharacterized protein with PIN domain